MVTKSVLALFGAVFAAFAVSFLLTFPAVGDANVLLGVIAFIGLLGVIVVSVYQGMKLEKKDVAVATWYKALWIADLIVVSWFCTRLGTLWGWW